MTCRFGTCDCADIYRIKNSHPIASLKIFSKKYPQEVVNMLIKRRKGE
jgi:hypothetical protein